MNRELIYVEFRKKAESDNKYFVFGRTGIIEETLAYLGLPSKEFKGACSCVHEDNLKTLHNFMLNEATDEQLELIYKVASGKEKIQETNPIIASSGKVFVSMPMNKEKYDNVDEIRNGIQSVISETNNEAYFVDLDIHNENIYNKIMEEIRSCKFLVADFTYQNAGVYYEAGYAKGIGKTGINTCYKEQKLHYLFVKQVFCE
jgi:hypothetical protein